MAWNDGASFAEEAQSPPLPLTRVAGPSIGRTTQSGMSESIAPDIGWNEGKSFGGAEASEEDTPWHSFVTGAGRTEEGIFDLSDLGTAGPFVDDDKVIPSEAAEPILAGMFSTTDPRELANIVKKHLPGAEIGEDKYGTPIITYKGNKFYTNAPGLTMQDISGGAIEALALTPFGRYFKGSTLLGAATKGGLIEGALQTGKEATTEALGGDVRMTEALARIGLGTAGGTVGGLAEPAIKAGRSVIKKADIAGLFNKAGIDWPSIPESQRKELIDALSKFSPRQLADVFTGKKGIENAQTLHRATIAADADIPLTKGQITGDTRQLNKEASISTTDTRTAQARAAQPEAIRDRIDTEFAPQPTTVKEAVDNENVAWKSVRDQAKGKRISRPEGSSLYNDAATALDSQDLALTGATPEAGKLMNKINKLAGKDWVPAQTILNIREEVSALLRPGNNLSGKDALAVKSIRDSMIGYLRKTTPELGGYLDDAMEATVSRGIFQKKSDLVVKELIGGHGKATKSFTPKMIEKRITDLFSKHGDFLSENFDLRELSELANIQEMAKSAQKTGKSNKGILDKYMRWLGPLVAGGAGHSAGGPIAGIGGAAGAALVTKAGKEISKMITDKGAVSFDLGDLLPSFSSIPGTAGGGLLAKQFEEEAEGLLKDFR